MAEAVGDMLEQPLGEWVLSRIRGDILSLKLAPGEVTSERTLEAAYGASRTPIRQALAELIREGLVVRTERGYVVAPFDLKQLAEIFEFREVVEDAAIRLASKRATAEELDSITRSIDDGLTDFTPDDWFRGRLDVHVQLAALAGNRFLRDAVQDAVNRTMRGRWLVVRSQEGRARAYREHLEIVAFMRQQRAEDAAAAIRKHAREVREQIMQALEDLRHLFGARGFVDGS